MDKPERKTVRERIEDAFRKIGTLLIAFAPLDAALSDRGAEKNLPYLLFFLGFGGSLFMLSLILEGRRSHAP